MLASRWHDHWGLLALTLLGTGLIIASACVFNNYLDRGLDIKMARTRQRALVNSVVSGRAALIYGSILGLAGETLLFAFVNNLTAWIGLAGWLAYVILYSLAKRRTVFGTLIGTLSGSTPPIAGYTAITGRLDATTGGLFLLMACWQMAHFYSIAMYRHADYQAAGLPVLPVVKGNRRAKLEIRLYIAAFGLMAVVLAIVSKLGVVFVVVIITASLAWLYKGSQPAASDKLWGRRMFLFSLIVVMIMSLMLAVGPLLP